MKKIVFPLIVMVFLCSCGSSIRKPQRDSNGKILKNGQFYDSQEEESGMVYICTGSSSHAYHSNEDCYGLQACRADIEIISIKEAWDMGRTPCHYCHEAAPQEVYICPSSESNAYHYDEDCKVLRRCAGDDDIITVTYEEAQEDERTPCYKCAR